MMSIVSGKLASKLVGENLSYKAILPDSYAVSGIEYPVLYLLHGLFGDFENWIELTRVAEIVDGRNLIVITPEGKDGWYVDSGIDENRRFESYMISELMPEVEDKFRIDGRRSMRAIAGNSMGGYGAIKFGLKYPSRFVLAGSFSGAFEAPQLSDENPSDLWGEYEPSIMAAFGADPSVVRKKNDLFEIVEKMSAPEIDALPKLYMDCGADDQFIRVNRELSEAMTKKGVRHEFHELKGRHDWKYWDSRLEHFLEKLGQLPGW
jgi:putative tributyrin esterase